MIPLEPWKCKSLPDNFTSQTTSDQKSSCSSTRTRNEPIPPGKYLHPVVAHAPKQLNGEGCSTAAPACTPILVVGKPRLAVQIPVFRRVSSLVTCTKFPPPTLKLTQRQLHSPIGSPSSVAKACLHCLWRKTGQYVGPHGPC
jgi:hypothetical protein